MPPRNPYVNNSRPPSSSHNREAQDRKRAAQDVDPRWLVKALVMVVSTAVFCGYLTLCLLFYIGQWQIVLHPVRTGSTPLRLPEANAELIRFAADDTGVPQLSGWWIPAVPGARYAQTTLLYLPSGDGSVRDAFSILAALHTIGLNLFAIDYRGYGQSAATRPNQKNMTKDVESALQYLRLSRHLPERQVVLYGAGVGASLAAQMARTEPGTSAIILESPRADLLTEALRDPRTSLVPARLLFKETFPLSDTLAQLRIPKLLLSGPQGYPAFTNAADPKMSVQFASVPGNLNSDPAFAGSITRFLDQYLPPTPVPSLPLPAGADR